MTDPATLVGVMTALGVIFPVLPTVKIMSSSFVITSSGGNLYAIAHFGVLAVYPKTSYLVISLTLITIPSISYAK